MGDAGVGPRYEGRGEVHNVQQFRAVGELGESFLHHVPDWRAGGGVARHAADARAELHEKLERAEHLARRVR